MGKIRLLTPDEEVEIGRRMEAAGIALRQALAGIPLAIRALLDLGRKLRRGEISADEVILLPEDETLRANIVEQFFRALRRVERLARPRGRPEPGGAWRKSEGCENTADGPNS